MLSNKILPAHLLAGYIWELWQANAGVSTIAGRDGKQIARIAPVQDEPDLADSGKTYLLYGFSEAESGNLMIHHSGTFAIRVIGKNFAELGQVMRIITDAFEVEDEAAHSVNVWSSFGPRANQMVGIRFTSACVTYTEAADAATTEGGTMEGFINIKYRYVIDSNVKTFAESGQWV